MFKCYTDWIFELLKYICLTVTDVCLFFCSVQIQHASRICWPICSVSPYTVTSSISAVKSKQRCRIWAESLWCLGWVIFSERDKRTERQNCPSLVKNLFIWSKLKLLLFSPIRTSSTRTTHANKLIYFPVFVLQLCSICSLPIYSPTF